MTACDSEVIVPLARPAIRGPVTIRISQHRPGELHQEIGVGL
jgi:hypothetical protein